MKKGNSIHQFLQKCLENLRKEEAFAELKVASSDNLMYIKEDLILPHYSTFFDFIVTKARGTVSISVIFFQLERTLKFCVDLD